MRNAAFRAFGCAGAIFSCRNLSGRLPRTHLVSSSSQMFPSVEKKAQQPGKVNVCLLLVESPCPCAEDELGWMGKGITSGSAFPSARSGRLRFPWGPGGSASRPPPRGDVGAERIPRTISTAEVRGTGSFRVAPGDNEYGSER